MLRWISHFLLSHGNFTQFPHLAIKELQIEVFLVEMKIVVDDEFVWHFHEAIFKH